MIGAKKTLFTPLRRFVQVGVLLIALMVLSSWIAWRVVELLRLAGARE